MPLSPNTARSGATARELSVTMVLDALQRSPRGSRAELAAQTGLSKPTVGAALTALVAGGLVRERGRSTGRRGPSATLYEFAPNAAQVIGIDIGAHRVLAVAADLAGHTRAEAEEPLTRPDVDALLKATQDAVASLHATRTERAIVGSPGIVDPRSARIRSSPQIDSWEGIEAERLLSELLGVPTIVENDVNLAAVGELAIGAGRGRTTFAYVSVGSGVGAGLVIDGHLHRGRHGAAGEVGFLASGPPPADHQTPGRGPMEMRLSRDALVRFARSLDPSAPDEPLELFDRARRGDRLGRAVVAEAADALAACIASINAVVDLELVLLGGGIGSQTDLLLEPVRTIVADLVPYAPEILPGELGEQATLAGAIATGIAQARTALIRRCLG